VSALAGTLEFVEDGRWAEVHPVGQVGSARFQLRGAGRGDGAELRGHVLRLSMTSRPIEVADAATRVEYVVWSEVTRTPAATAFLAVLDIPAQD